ncbi:MobQ family relaxase [Psychrobacter sp. APC 3350]|uniref:MobQ family relaxase n=1 Tax=Psychrobacter sp. APC 3350 TaxID=3035195 RepID=UPI0025B5AE46|nr:MobQ family relaxase [Psychrobacter sp. APC 3350]MDN3454391.1 MobQ family relaxase [Psychrobacter sp. APC 3350]
MAIYHLSVKTFSRSNGRSATAAVAYRAGAKIRCDHERRDHDYSKKRDVIHSEIFLPPNAPSWATDRQQLWNEVERAEKRKNSTVAREFEVALPNELNEEQRIALVQDFAKQIVARHGCAVDAHLHDDKGSYKSKENQHAHIMLTTRRLEPEGFTKKTRELDEKKSGEVVYWREQWAKTANEHLREYGIEIDHRSLKDQGLEREPTIKMGVAASALERRGIKTDRGDINREVAKYNKVLETNSNEKINEILSKQLKQATELHNKLQFIKRRLPEVKRDIAEKQPELYQAFDDLGIPTAEPEPIRSVDHERGRELPPVGSSESNELGQGHTSEVRYADQTVASSAPRDIAERTQKPSEPNKSPQAIQESLQPDSQAVAAEQEGLRANIEAVKRMVSEVYANEPEKLKKMLNAIDDKIPDIMSGEVVLPPIKVETIPERVAVRTPKPSKDQDIER